MPERHATSDQTPPPAELVLRGKLGEVYDGDTVTVDFTIRARIRLLDCWAPEVRTTDEAEKVKGYASRDHLRSLVKEGDPVKVVVPLDGTTRLDDLITMGRVLGTVWAGGKNLSVEQVAAGHATTAKK